MRAYPAVALLGALLAAACGDDRGGPSDSGGADGGAGDTGAPVDAGGGEDGGGPPAWVRPIDRSRWDSDETRRFLRFLTCP